MTVVTAMGMLRAGGRVHRAGFAGYWIASRTGRKRPLSPDVFQQLQARGQVVRVAARVGVQWKWSGKKAFPMPIFKPGGRCAGAG